MLTRSFLPPELRHSIVAYTPMLHARMFTETVKFRDHHFQPTKSGLGSSPKWSNDTSTDLHLDGNPQFDRPLLVQFCANDPDELLEAARYVEPYCDAVDLNLGCPQGIARRGNYGAFLQEDWDLIYRLINKLHANLGIPVTAKMRILETKEKTLEYAKMILLAGASIITVHGRQRDQKGHNTGLADWTVLRFLRENLPPDTVIFANGNILRHEDIAQCLEETKADGVMTAEGNLYDPTIFASPPAPGSEGREYWRGRDGKGGYRMDAVFRRYMDLIHTHILVEPAPTRPPLFLHSDTPSQAPLRLNGTATTAPFKDGQPAPKKQKRDTKYKRPTNPNLLAMQPHLFHLLRPLVSKHHAIRDALSKTRAGDIPGYEIILRMVEDATKEGLLDYEANPEKYDDDVEEESKGMVGMEQSSLEAVKRCRRPWWVCQPYVRPLPSEAVEKGSLTLSKKEMRSAEENKEVETVKGQRSEREARDVRDGMGNGEVIREAMVAG